MRKSSTLGVDLELGDDEAVNYWHGDITWDTFHYDEGEFSFLIYGVTRLRTLETTC